MNIKKIICLSLAFVMLLPFCTGAKTLEFTLGEASMLEFDGASEIYILETAPYAANQRTMVPVRIISERFGADVDWNGATNEITITKGDNVIVLTLGKAEATVNGTAIVLDVAPEAFNGRTMVPLRFISENLEMDVEYIPLSGQILIDDEKTVMTVSGIDVTIADYASYLSFVGYDPANDDIKEIVDEATRTFKEVYSAAAGLKSAGFVLNDEYFNDAKKVFASLKSDFGQNALTAPVARFLEYDMYLNQVVDSYVSSDETKKAVLEYYNDNYITAKYIFISLSEHSDSEAKSIATDIIEKIKSGGDIDVLKAEYCEDAGIPVNPDGNNFAKEDMPEECATVAFALDVGEVSEPVKTSYGYYIIKRCPLAGIDYYTAYVLSEQKAQAYYDGLVKEAVASADIKVNMSTDEIIKFID